MKEFKGTPGPWFVGDELRVFTDEGRYICRQSVVLADEKAEANAHLIAAAPQMLEALQDLVALVKSRVYPQPDKPSSDWGRAEAAESIIAKALGETK